MGDDYILRLTKMKCQFGTKENYLNVDVDHGVLAGDEQQPLMNANDHVGGKHIIHFGDCRSEMNPERIMKKKMVEAAGGNYESMEQAGVVSVKCKPQTDMRWWLTNDKHIIDGAPALIQKSCTTCRYGGKIELVAKSQSEGSLDRYEDSEEEQQEKKEPDRTVEEETEAVFADAMAKIASTGAGKDTSASTDANAGSKPGNTAGRRGRSQQQAQTALVAASSFPAVQAMQVLDKQREEAGTFTEETPWEGPLECPRELQEANYRHNQGVPFTGGFVDSGGRITDQSLMGDFQMSHFSVPVTGCGAVAAYNVMKILEPENQKSFADILYEMEPYGILNHSYGLMPAGITDYLIRQGYEVGYEVSDIWQKGRDAGAGILLSVGQAGAHYAAFMPEPDGQTFTCFNQKDMGEVFSNVVMTVKKPEKGRQKTWDTLMKSF